MHRKRPYKELVVEFKSYSLGSYLLGNFINVDIREDDGRIVPSTELAVSLGNLKYLTLTTYSSRTTRLSVLLAL